MRPFLRRCRTYWEDSLPLACAAWPVPDLGDAWREPVGSPVPTLFVSGTLDPRTPPSAAEALLPGFPNGAHLRVDGGGHDDDLLVTSDVVAQAIVDFLGGAAAPRSRRVPLPPLRFEHP